MKASHNLHCNSIADFMRARPWDLEAHNISQKWHWNCCHVRRWERQAGSKQKLKIFWLLELISKKDLLDVSGPVKKSARKCNQTFSLTKVIAFMFRTYTYYADYRFMLLWWLGNSFAENVYLCCMHIIRERKSPGPTLPYSKKQQSPHFWNH
jgi:hypothetical protein